MDVAPRSTRARRGAELTTETPIAPAATEQPPVRPALHTMASLRRPEGRPFVRGLVLLTLVGAAVRLMDVLWWRPTTTRPGYHGYALTGDSFYYHLQANALAAGEWFVDPIRWFNTGEGVASAAHPPLYSTYLGLWSTLGIDTVTGHRLASALLGIAAVALIGSARVPAGRSRRRSRRRRHRRGLPATVDQRRCPPVGVDRRPRDRVRAARHVQLLAALDTAQRLCARRGLRDRRARSQRADPAVPGRRHPTGTASTRHRLARPDPPGRRRLPRRARSS